MANGKTKSDKQREFITLYNEVHGFLSTELYGKSNSENYQSFKDCIEKIRNSNQYPTLKRYYNELVLINRFRNLIVHGYGDKFYDIAEPTEHAMNVLNSVHSFFMKPVKISEFLTESGNPKPKILEIEVNLFEVLELISEYSYSQFPVFKDDEFMGMITDNGLTNFTASELNLTNGFIIFEEHTIEDIISSENIDENNKKYSILFQDKELYKVLDEFSKVDKATNYILISKSGKEEFREESDLVGIFTTEDIPNIVKRLER